MTKWFISIKPAYARISPQSIADAEQTALLMFSPPQKNLPPCVYRLWGNPQAGKIRLLCGVQCAGQVSRTPPLWFWRILPGLSSGSAKRSHKPAICSFQTLSTQIPHIEFIFFLNLYPRFFFLCYQDLGEQRKKTEEWRKTIIESARRKKEKKEELTKQQSFANE